MTGPNTTRRAAGGLGLTGLYLAGMVLIYVAERILFESTSVRLGLVGLGLLGIAAAIGGRVLRAKNLGPMAVPVERRLLTCYLVGLLALALYAAQADFVLERLRPLFTEAKSAERYGVILGALWPVLWICSAMPLVFIEISYAPMDPTRTVELKNIQRSTRSALILAMTICTAFALNYVVAEYNKKVDLSYFKTTHPSESTRKMLKNLSAPFRAVLFFPSSNEVREQARAYFEGLKAESSHFKLELTDHALDPGLAKELSVSDNGIVVLARGKQTHQINLGTTINQAKGKLKKLDSEFQTAFLKLATQQKVAYLTVGHEELTRDPRDDVQGSSIRDLRMVLEKLNYDLKDLGIGQGLASEIPKDATMVIIAGPRKEFLPAEVSALKNYLRGGGRVLFFLDPEGGWNGASLLNPFGLKFQPVRLSNDRYHARLTYTPADRHFVFSTAFSAHPSVSTLSRNAPRMASVFLGAGYLEEQPPTETNKTQVQFTVHSMPFTWDDLDNNHEYDAKTEKRKVYELAAAVTMKPVVPAPKKGAPEEHEMRLVVVADADVISDKVFRNPGNGYLLVDAMKWLGGEERFIGETTSEEDVRITHTRKEDQAWFYLTIFGMPALVLGCGIYYTRRRRKQ
ncbi:MAG: Gldg family protein [Deltaproteobacteria bacterium]|nr:Gldg family protein [Deltaproteobacteria bacterium]